MATKGNIKKSKWSIGKEIGYFIAGIVGALLFVAHYIHVADGMWPEQDLISFAFERAEIIGGSVFGVAVISFLQNVYRNRDNA